MTGKYTSFAYEFKYIIIGDTGIGKTCLLLQFTTKKFAATYDVTVGVDFGTSTINVESGERIKLHIWDTSGQDAFQSITRSYYRSAIIALLVYDITSKESFNHLRFWLQKLRDDGSDDLIIMLIGNKSDIEHKRQVSTQHGIQFAKENNLFSFMEASAKTGMNVEKAFKKPCQYLFDFIQKDLIKVGHNTQGIKLGPDSQFHSFKDENALAKNKTKKKCSCVII